MRHSTLASAVALLLIESAMGFTPLAGSLPIHPVDWPDSDTPRTAHPLRFHVGFAGWGTAALRPFTFTYPRD